MEGGRKKGATLSWHHSKTQSILMQTQILGRGHIRVKTVWGEGQYRNLGVWVKGIGLGDNYTTGHGIFGGKWSS